MADKGIVFRICDTAVRHLLPYRILPSLSRRCDIAGAVIDHRR
jgi:hypothetical protein